MLRTSIKKYGEKLLNEGLQKGLQKGILEGKHIKALETAKALLMKKISVSEISEITGLSIKEIEKLKASS